MPVLVVLMLVVMVMVLMVLVVNARHSGRRHRCGHIGQNARHTEVGVRASRRRRHRPGHRLTRWLQVDAGRHGGHEQRTLRGGRRRRRRLAGARVADGTALVNGNEWEGFRLEFGEHFFASAQ